MNHQFVTFSDGTLLSCFLASPFISMLLLAALPLKSPKLTKLLASASAFVSLLMSCEVFRHYDESKGTLQLAEKHVWIDALNITYTVGVDGMSIWFILLTCLLTFLVCLSTPLTTNRLRGYFVTLFLLQMGICGTFLALDGILFYLFWELMLIPMFFMLSIWGGKLRKAAVLKFLLFTASGSLMMLVAITYLGVRHEQAFGTLSFFFYDWQKLGLTHSEQMYLFAAFVFAFAIKIPLFPLHGWLADALVEAPLGGAVMFSAVLFKQGLYGLIRFGLPVFPDAVQSFAPFLIVCGLLGLIYGALVAWQSTDMRKLLAYATVSHLGFCVIGFATLSIYGLSGCVMQMINHAVTIAGLFFAVDCIERRYGTRDITELGGLAKPVPYLAVYLAVFSLSLIGVPLTNCFPGELLLLIASFSWKLTLGAISSLSVILGALYTLSWYRRTCFGPVRGAALAGKEQSKVVDVLPSESIVMAPLLILVVAFGVFPGPILKGVETASQHKLSFLPGTTETHQPGAELKGDRSKTTKGLTLSEVTYDRAVN